MDLYRIIGELVEERERLVRIIESLETMSDTGGNRDTGGRRGAGGRTPRARKSRRGRKSMDDSARQEVSARMKLYWAKRRAAVSTENTAQ